MIDPLQPSATTLVKLGSAIIHADEFLSDDGHPYDRVAFEELLRDPDVVEWVAAMNAMAMLPVKRKP